MSAKLVRRTSRPVPASITSVVLLALGALLATAAIARLVTGAWYAPLADSARASLAWTWGSAPILTAAAVALVLGLVLLLSGVSPGPLRAAPLRTRDQPADAEYAISTRALARVAAARAQNVDGVQRVSASASGSSVTVSVGTASEQTDAIASRVRDAVSDGLARTGVSPVPGVKVNVRRKAL